jgi:hypothetical protein
MDQMLSISLNFEGQNFMICDYMQLDPCAPNSGRRFTFAGIKSKTGAVIHNSIITINIEVSNKWSQFVSLNQFNLLVLNFYDLPNGEWCVYGHPMDLETTEYRQGEVDIFYNWQRGQSFDWFRQTINSSLKLDYISACMAYSGLPTQISDKELFHFDLSLIKEERDFYYLASLELVGDRGYFGHDFHTFRDCLLELYNHNGFFYGKKIEFTNSIHSDNIELYNLLNKIKAKLTDFKFSVIS